MKKLMLPLLCKVYIMLAMVLASIYSPLRYTAIGIALLLLTLATVIRRFPAAANAVSSMIIIFLMPMTLASALERITTLPVGIIYVTAIILIAPAVYLLDLQLRQITVERQELNRGKPGRRMSRTFVSSITAAVIIMVLSPVLNQPVLLYTGIALASYLLIVFLITLLDLPSRPIVVDVKKRSIVAGNSDNIHVQIKSGAHVKLYTSFRSPDDWVRVFPERTILNGEPAGINISFTPTLACQSPGALQASMTDTRGLLQVDQELHVLELHVIPRARYAEWLARKYLEQAGTGTIAAALLPSRAEMSLSRGVEYVESRTYQPGDSLKSIDWKKTARLNQLIVKEYREGGEQSAIIAVNLSVSGAEVADKLAFNLISIALTMARENIPSALTAYNHEEVVLETGIKEPLAILERTLGLIREINVVKPVSRYLEPLDTGRIKRNIRLLQQSRAGPALKLLDIFRLESRAIDESARNHPASTALQGIARRVKGPALIILISQLDQDAEAVLVTKDKLARSGFTTVPVGTG